MENSPEQTMMEEREELMAAAGGGEPIFRTAHFLTPTQSISHLAAFPRSLNTTTLSSPNVVYQGWRGPQKGWERWVHQLEPMYGEIWKRAGIYDAILASTYNVVKNRGSKNLMLKLAEKWCPKTNSFLFPWGECTVTLEDVMVLGGFPVLGELVFRPCGSDEMLSLEKKLTEERLKIRRITGQTAREGTWLGHFMGGGSEKLEHEAFLVLWLTRFVFPNPTIVVDKGLFLIAITLSRGIRIAFGPAVLASIYRDLSSLKKVLFRGSLGQHEKLVLSSPLGIVQIWAWERFCKLSPIPFPVKPEEPRLAMWSGVSSLVINACDVAQVLNSSGQNFQWQPYVRDLRNWDYKNLYNGYIMAGSEMDCEAIQVLVRCWRNSELVGMDSVEQYLPHRVGMQFGFDQDLPGHVERLNAEDPDKAWLHYNRPVKGTKIYIPARLSEPNVTKRYQESWSRAQEMGDHDQNPASGKANEMEELLLNDNLSVQITDKPERMEICDGDPLIPPGFGPKTGDSSEQDQLEYDSSTRNKNGSFELGVELGITVADHSVTDRSDLGLGSGNAEMVICGIAKEVEEIREKSKNEMEGLIPDDKMDADQPEGMEICDEDPCFGPETNPSDRSENQVEAELRMESGIPTVNDDLGLASGNLEMVICGIAKEVEEIREKKANEMEELIPNDKMDAEQPKRMEICEKDPCFGPEARDPSDRPENQVEAGLRMELGTPAVNDDLGLTCGPPEPQPRASEAVVEAAPNQAGSRRLFTVEEVTARVVNLEKLWAAVKAKQH